MDMSIVILKDRSILVVRIRLAMKLLLLLSIVIVIYQYSNCFSSLSSISSSRSRDLVPFNSILGVTSNNVIAYSNGNDSFYSGESNYFNGIYMGLKWQCVEYARRWIFTEKNLVFESIQGANLIWTQLKFVERVKDGKRFPLKHHWNGSPSPPLNGTLIIYPIQNAMPYGHVAVIVQVLPKSIRIAEQNFHFSPWKDHYAREIPMKTINGSYFVQDQYQIYGWIQIDNQPFTH